ncbi:GIY-YIG nuclease family protein [Brevundimonas subvibrioides]|uniref:GIY-YIG nuclease family protein n=1 Tax=Brevundimonas subvibrioides TaxID=74313 RepID=UPI0032D58B75
MDSKRTSISDRVWARFSDDPDGLAAETASIQARWQEGTTGSFKPTATNDFIEPSRGPSAWAGSYHVARVDGDRWVYLLVLAEEGGSLEPPGKVFFKIGRSGDLDRRRSELNWGFPPGFGFQWQIVDSILFGTEGGAAETERSVLAGFAQAGLCVGGEFVKSEFGAARDLFGRLARVESFSR